MKATTCTCTLTSYIPMPHWLNLSKEVTPVLTTCLYHAYINIISKNLKWAEVDGAYLSNPMGHLRHCHTPLVSWICDLSEQHPQPHHTHTHTHTHTLIWQAFKEADPALIPQFMKTCEPLDLNGVHQLFDHVFKWVINIMGGDELDQHIFSLQPHVGVHHWAHWVSKLKQCMGWEHWEIKRIIITVATGTVDYDIPETLPALQAISTSSFRVKVSESSKSTSFQLVRLSKSSWSQECYYSGWQTSGQEQPDWPLSHP